MTLTDFTPGDIVAFDPLPNLVFTPPRRWAAPDGAPGHWGECDEAAEGEEK